jgi:pSer/pThr/pTyr-binding forkhead associated (FHA) protein
MPESLLAWYHRFTDDAKRLEQRLKGRPVLLYDPPPIGPEDSAEEYQFRTQSGMEVTAIGGGDPLAAVVEKSKDNAFQRRVTVGRTANNDIVLEDASVSRFHAWFQPDDSGKGWVLYDAGSRNGTQLSGKRLAPKVPAPLTSGQKLRVGAVELTFLSAEAFLQLLKKRLDEG